MGNAVGLVIVIYDVTCDLEAVYSLKRIFSQVDSLSKSDDFTANFC